MLNLIIEYAPAFLTGILETLAIAIVALIEGLLIGISLTTCSAYSHSMHLIVRCFSNVIIFLPELFILFLIYFAGTEIISAFLHQTVEINAFMASTFTLALVFGCYAYKIFYSNFINMPDGEKEAAKILGLSEKYIWRKILLPSIFQKSLPGLGNLWLILLKETSIVSLIGATELLSRIQFIIVHTQQPFIFYSITAILYFTLSNLSENGLKRLVKI